MNSKTEQPQTHFRLLPQAANLILANTYLGECVSEILVYFFANGTKAFFHKLMAAAISFSSKEQ